MAREIRRGRPSDLPAIIDVFWRGVHEGAAPRYSEAERRAWLPARPEPETFGRRLAGQAVFVAEEAGRVSGFMTLAPDGLLDFAYVLPEARRSGTADDLLAIVLNHAAAEGLPALRTRASDMARPFFARHGWQVTRPAPQCREGVVISATEMELPLAARVFPTWPDPAPLLSRM
ncbi:GNAT family N-acetyltransferase [Jannaschia marina]|uniref:GNAT family N-acetyltransferase n=1 Tax=Jannaschia marina TaxID=2741674 RepID=UPI0015CD8543|nr:GNAT family N-acetyltransferase [Jannaschia marina]